MSNDITQVEFDEAAHEYTYHGRTLKGITGVIGEYLGKCFPRGNPAVELAASYGSQVHKEVERYFMEEAQPTTESAKYVVQVLKEHGRRFGMNALECEKRVSDFSGTASNVDVVMYTDDGVHLYDIKTGAFDRAYCTLQLNAYRKMWKMCYVPEVNGMHVICTKSRRVFDIVGGHDDEVFRLLARNMA